MAGTSGRYPVGLLLIGGFKFFCGLLLVALGVGLFRHAHDDLADQMERVIKSLRLDPENHYVHSLIEKVSGVKPEQLRAIGVGTFLYALMYLVEGGGLLLRKHWAEYLTVAATGLFIPLEIFEVVKRPTALRVGLLVINAAIVAYLVFQLRRKESEGASLEPSPAPSS